MTIDPMFARTAFLAGYLCCLHFYGRLPCQESHHDICLQVIMSSSWSQVVTCLQTYTDILQPLYPPIHCKWFDSVYLPCNTSLLFMYIDACLWCCLLPGYRQVRGCAANLGAEISAFPLAPNNDWRPDLAALEAAVTKDTRLIAGTPAILLVCSFRASA